MEHKASITALMRSFGRTFHAEHEEHPVFADHLARALMTDEEYAAVQSDILDGEPMKPAFSCGALEKLLEKHGFLIYELLTPDDIQRDIIDRAGADLKAFEHVNDCLAVRKNSDRTTMKYGVEDGNELQTQKPTDRLLRTGLRKMRCQNCNAHER